MASQTSSYREQRARMDYTWFPQYPEERVRMQDGIVDRILAGASETRYRTALFTCGMYGSSKTHSMRNELAHSFGVGKRTLIDPDTIRHQLPEWPALVRTDPLTAGDLTQKEATFIALLTERVCLDRGFSYMVDGSLVNADWYQEWFAEVRRHGFVILLLKFSCSPELAARRCQKRAEQTGRTIPIERLHTVAQGIRVSWQRLKPLSVAWWEFDTSESNAALVATGSNS